MATASDWLQHFIVRCRGHSKIQAIAAVDGWDGKWPVCMGQLNRLDWRVHRASLAECMCGRQACVFDLSG